jgi:hypothetical protein
MDALTLDDLLPLEEFAGKRREFRAAHQRYLDRYRRIRLGPALTLVFENRQTLWFRVQEVLRVARLVEPTRIQRELDCYNRLLPGRDRLQAALVIAAGAPNGEPGGVSPGSGGWHDLHGDELCLLLGAARYPANLLTCRPEDRCAGAAHWVQFVLDPAGRVLLADPRCPALLVVSRPNYRHDTGPLSDDVRQSLLDDLALSDRAR